MTHANITEQTIRDRIAAWGVPRRIAELTIAEVVVLTPYSENQLNNKLTRYRQKKSALVMVIQDALDDFTESTGQRVRSVDLGHHETTLPSEWKRQWMYVVDVDVGRTRNPRATKGESHE